MVGIFSVALIGKSFPSRPGNHIVAFLRTVIATRLPVHVVILPLRPPLLEFLAPNFLPHTRIAPGEIIVVETVILIDRHPISDIRVLIKFLAQAEAYLKEFSGPGGVDVLRSAKSDCL